MKKKREAERENGEIEMKPDERKDFLFEKCLRTLKPAR